MRTSHVSVPNTEALALPVPAERTTRSPTPTYTKHPDTAFLGSDISALTIHQSRMRIMYTSPWASTAVLRCEHQTNLRDSSVSLTRRCINASYKMYFPPRYLISSVSSLSLLFRSCRRAYFCKGNHFFI